MRSVRADAPQGPSSMLVDQRLLVVESDTRGAVDMRSARSGLYWVAGTTRHARCNFEARVLQERGRRVHPGADGDTVWLTMYEAFGRF